MTIFQRFAAGRFALLLTACFFFAISTASAQEQARMSLTEGSMTMAEFFSEVRRQTGTIVIFDAGNVPPKRRITLPTGDHTVVELLNRALPEDIYVWRTVGTYVVVQTLPAPLSPTVAGPTQEEFERDVAEYTRRNLGRQGGEVVIQYDTIRTGIPHNGVFNYPGSEFTPVHTDRISQTSFSRNTPPMFAVKTNLVWWAARGTLNIGGEIGLGKRTSLEIMGGINRWNLRGSDENNKKLTHWVVKPEFRYWLCERFNGHFFGLHALYGQYNVGGVEVPLLFEKEYRYEGNAAYGGGINYGYHLPFAKRWGVEFTAGVGVMRLDYTRSDCLKCGSEIGKQSKTYFGPTELGVKLIFMIK